MHWLKPKFSDDRGAIAIIVAVILSSTLLFATLALVGDSGNIFRERQVQNNSADAAAIALSQECALNGPGAITTSNFAGYGGPVCLNRDYAKGFAGKYTNLNSPDGMTNVSLVCGPAALDPCGTNTHTLADCNPVPAVYTKYVRVETSTKSTEGNFLQTFFGGLLDPPVQSTVINGCAQSAWGPSERAPVVMPLALGICEFKPDGTSVFYDPDASAPTWVAGAAGLPTTLVDYNGRAINCVNTLKGLSLFSTIQVPSPGWPNFAFQCPSLSLIGDPPANSYLKVGTWLKTEKNVVSAIQIPCGGTAAISKETFRANLQAIVDAGAGFFIPVVGPVTANGQGTWDFQVVSFFYFKLQEFNFENKVVSSNTSHLTSAACSPSGSNITNNNCIYGQFSRAIVPNSNVSTRTDLPAVGAFAIQLLP